MWTLLIIAVANGVVSTATFNVQIPMHNKAACIAAATTIKKDSKGVAYVCISSETGEVLQL